MLILCIWKIYVFLFLFHLLGKIMSYFYFTAKKALFLPLPKVCLFYCQESTVSPTTKGVSILLPRKHCFSHYQRCVYFTAKKALFLPLPKVCLFYCQESTVSPTTKGVSFSIDRFGLLTYSDQIADIILCSWHVVIRPLRYAPGM